jgi:hypothetical protein
MQRKYFLFISLFAFLLGGCQSNRWDIDISGIAINQNFERFDRDLFETPTDSIWSSVPVWENKYGNFFEAYNQQIISIGGTNQLDYAEKLSYFMTDPYIAEAYTDVQKKFPTLYFENKLSDAFKRYHFYFPQKPIPNIYTHISGFNQSIVVDSNYISISLDKYLGASCKYYSMLRTPMYLRQNMHPDKINSDVIMALALTEFPYQVASDNLISQMIYYGKIHVFIDALLPDAPDSIKWGLPENKLQWCAKNEQKMWLYLIENKLLFTSDYKEMKRYIDDGPFTTNFSKESPARTGRWIGYQIVQSYLNAHPNTSLLKLMQITDYQLLLSESKYKP